MSTDNAEQSIRRQFRNVDALEVKPDFILGTSVEELAERLAAKRGTSVAQAQHFLERVRARDGWIRERELHLLAVTAAAQKASAVDRATALATEQAAVADRLVQLGLDELTTTRSLSRQDALKTLELGWKFHYRSVGQPDHVIDPALIPTPGALGEQSRRADELQKMPKSEMLALMKHFVEQEEKKGTTKTEEE